MMSTPNGQYATDVTDAQWQRRQPLLPPSTWRQGEAIRTWVARVKQTYKIDLEVVAKQGPGFTVVKRRWVVERTFAWLMNFRRHARDYEGLNRHSEAFIQIAMIHVLLKRIK